MLTDFDTSVITNTIFVLEEIHIPSGGYIWQPSTVLYLLSRLGEFSEWGLNAVLEIIMPKYTPKSESEIFNIMNLLDPVLRSSNCGAILAIIKIFLYVTKSFLDLQIQVYVRIKPPLLTLITGSVPELQYILLKHFELILQHTPAKGIFDDEFRQLFVRYNESSHVKYLKVSLLPKLANVYNAIDIITELCEYVVDVDKELSQKAIKSLGDVALLVYETAATIIEKLIEFIELDNELILNESLKTTVLIIKKYPILRSFILISIPKYLKRIEDAETRGCVLWMIGEYCDQIIEAPYLLEPLIYDYTIELPTVLKLHLLTATLKVFFKYPPATFSILNKLFEFMLNDTSNQDVHDRVLLYYRMLQYDIEMAKSLTRRDPVEEEIDEINHSITAIADTDTVI